jgi:hypothetical protein
MVPNYIAFYSMNGPKLTRSFQVQIYGFSGESIEVHLQVDTQKALQLSLQSFFANIYRYLTTLLALSSEHLYVYLNVSLEEWLPEIRLAAGRRQYNPRAEELGGHCLHPSRLDIGTEGPGADS